MRCLLLVRCFKQLRAVIYDAPKDSAREQNVRVCERKRAFQRIIDFGLVLFPGLIWHKWVVSWLVKMVETILASARYPREPFECLWWET